eukprot:COSAG03_NODE_3687_length_1876_cov_49.891390_1_plen_96_part_00
MFERYRPPRDTAFKKRYRVALCVRACVCVSTWVSGSLTLRRALSLSLSLSLWRSADAAAEPTKWVSIWNASDVVRGGVEKGVAAPIDIIPVYRRF